jgi:hypothetical protein
MMAPSSEPEWTDEGFVSQEGADPLEQMREWILRLLIQGVPRGEIFDGLINQGCKAEYASGLIGSVMQTGRHDGVVHGTVTYYGGTPVFFDEDWSSKRRRRSAERGQRKIREMKEGTFEPPAELCFDESPNPSKPVRRYSRSFIRPLLLIMLGVGCAVAAALYWLTK